MTLTRSILVALLVVSACCKQPQNGDTTPAPTPTPTPTPTPPPASTCTKDQPCERRVLAACPADVAPISVAAALADPKLVGQQVQIGARLVQGPTMCTRMACSVERPCCNRCSSRLVLADAVPADQSPLPPEGTISLGEELVCPGDDSGVCCPYLPGAEIVAMGRLLVEGVEGEPPRGTLVDPTFCTR
jgi:hypothetical protein